MLFSFQAATRRYRANRSGGIEPVVGPSTRGWLEGIAMARSIDFRVPLLVGAAVVLLAFSQAKASEPIQFVSGTGEVADEPVELPVVLPYANAQSADRGDAQAELSKFANQLSSRKTQDSVATMVERMTGTMLDFPIGKFVAALEQSVPGANKGKKRIRATDTVADIAGRDADSLPEKLANSSRDMMGMMSGLAAAFATMVPEFEKLSRDMEKSFDDIDNKPTRKGD